MNIIVCCKFVPCLQDMETGPDKSVNFSKAQWQISDYDLQAIEAGIQLAKACGGNLIAVSAGTTKIESTQLRKDLLSRGPDELYLIADDALENADTAQISALLAEAVKKIGADLVICGEGSADYYYQQTGLQLGERLGWISLGNIDAVSMAENSIVVERALETEIEKLSAPLPAVISVTSSINVPPRPNMRAILSAGKKPVTIWSLADFDVAEAVTETISTQAPDSAERAGEILEGGVAEAAAEMARRLKADGLL